MTTDGDVMPRPPGGLSEKIFRRHRERLAIVYIRQSTVQQVERHQESTRLQYALVDRAFHLGWARETIVVVDDDLGRSGATIEGRLGFQPLVAEVGLGRVGLMGVAWTMTRNWLTAASERISAASLRSNDTESPNHRHAAALPRGFAVGLGVVAFIGNDGPRSDVRFETEQSLELRAVGRLGAGQVKVERQAVAVALEMDLGAEPAAGTAKHVIFLRPFAPAAEICARDSAVENLDQCRALTARTARHQCLEKRLEGPGSRQPREPLPDGISFAELRRQCPPGDVVHAEIVLCLQELRNLRSSRPLSPRLGRSWPKMSTTRPHVSSLICVSMAGSSESRLATNRTNPLLRIGQICRLRFRPHGLTQLPQFGLKSTIRSAY